MDSISRHIQGDLRRLHSHSRGRLLVITGARQTGKSTLASLTFPEYPVVNLDSAQERAAWERVGPDGWIARFPRAIVDEAQKMPEVFDTLKAAYDRNRDVRYVLLGSSQILLLDRVRETLAGRVAIRELFPFLLTERLHTPGDPSPPATSRLCRLLEARKPAEALPELLPESGPDARSEHARARWDEFVRWGAMPPLWQPDWTDQDRFEWLQDYQATYLQRDLRDLARIDRLEPFVRAQQAAALRVSRPLNVAEIARLAGTTAKTAADYLRYLAISYQLFELPAWFRSPEKRLVKQPRIHWFDPGVLRAVLKRRGDPDGFEVENAVIAEIAKQCRTARLPVELSYLRTADGREVDLLVEREDGFFAIECKATTSVAAADHRHLLGLEAFLDKPLLAGLVVSNDRRSRRVDRAGPPIWYVEAPVLLS